VTALPRAAIGPALSARIRGRAEVEHLRRLVAGAALPGDVADALAWCAEELRVVAWEDWGPPGGDEHGAAWTAATAPALKVATELVILRTTLSLLLSAAPDPSRALSSEFAVPLPPGLELYPFQRAAVEYAMGIVNDKSVDMGLNP